jgi:virulence-associated protein VapD
MILRGINSRLGILEDYLYNENLKDSERNHWERVAQAYRDLRTALSKKKFKEKSWGVFIDYNALDELDKKKDDKEE